MDQTILDIQIPEIKEKAQAMKAEGRRLVQICCTKLPDKLELQYSYDKNFDFISFRVTMADVSTPILSISDIFLNAFLYENEIHDLYGVQVQGIAVDYKGNFYRTDIKRAFNPEQPVVEGSQS
jgi:ech hydrogenase subunit D